MERIYSSERRQLKDISYEIFIVLLSALSIVNVILLLLPLSPLVKEVIEIVELVISLILLVDFTYRLFTAPSKVKYFFYNWGWIDLLSSLPIIYARVFRLVRIRHVVQLMRQKGMSRKILHRFFQIRATSVLFVMFFLIIVMMEFGGMAVLYVEQISPDANIITAEEAIWWVFVTIATVGYGDYFPVTSAGRVISMVVMILGVTTFSVLTSFLARAFANVRSDDDIELDETSSHLDIQVSSIKELHDIINQQQEANEILKKRLIKLEQSLTNNLNKQ